MTSGFRPRSQLKADTGASLSDAFHFAWIFQLTNVGYFEYDGEDIRPVVIEELFVPDTG
jgi:hypothetical protein